MAYKLGDLTVSHPDQLLDILSGYLPLPDEAYSVRPDWWDAEPVDNVIQFDSKLAQRRGVLEETAHEAVRLEHARPNSYRDAWWSENRG